MGICKRGCALLVGLGLAVVSWGQTVRLGSVGNLAVSYGGVDVFAGDSLLLMDTNWKAIEGLQNARVEVTQNGQQTTASYTGPLISLTKSVENRDDAAIVTWTFTIKPHADGRQVELCLNIDAAWFDHLPLSGVTHDVQRSAEVLKLQALVGDFVLDVHGSTSPWSFDDMRSAPWSKKFRLRFAPSYDPATGLQATAVIRFRGSPSTLPGFVPLAVSASGNRGLQDDVAEDGQGGWTDQGRNDLRALPLGLLPAQGVSFRLAEPVVVLRGSERPAFPSECREVPVGIPVHGIRFLHTAAWSAERGVPVAEYVIRYTDGKELVVPVRYGMEINDWWNVQAPSHARIAWQGANGESEVAVYAMQWTNPNADIPVAGVRMRSRETDCVPAWLAATAIATEGFTGPQITEIERLFSQRPNRSEVDMSGWIPCPIAWNGGIAAGTALDVSFLNEKPAGEAGFLTVRNGHFYFPKRPDQPVRFWGTNAALRGPYPTKEDAPGIARCLARQGVNLVRIHLYAVYDDTLIAEDGSMNPEALDRMDFFLSQLKQNGIYIYMDLNDGMLFDRLVGHKLPDNKKAKLAALFNRELIGATQKLARMFFTHTNPYTSLRLCDDPAVCMYEITNENSITMNWGRIRDRLCEPWLSELGTRWREWLTVHDREASDLPDSLSATPDGCRFTAEMQKTYLDEMKAFLRDIGVKAPICGTNITFTLGDLWASSGMDYTNDHAYWDHTSTFGQYRTYNNRSVLLSPAWHAGTLPSFARAKVTGMPTVASEWNYVYPNHYRCEGLPYMTAYSAYQDWDAPMFYCATGSFDSGTWSRFHETPGILVHSQQTDPATWGQSQICALLFRRGDVAVGTRELIIRYGPDQIWENRSVLGRMPFLAAVARLETRLVDENSAEWPTAGLAQDAGAEELYLDALKRIGDTQSSTDRVISDTGELRRDTKEGYFLVDTPRTQIACGCLNRLTGERDKLSQLTVNSPNDFATLALSSLDGRPLGESSRMLLTAVGNARNADAEIEDFVIKNMGRKGPVMAEPVQAVISLKRVPGHPLKAYALDTLTGERRQELTVSASPESVTVEIGRQYGTIYYELSGN